MPDDRKQLELAVKRGDITPAAQRIVESVALPETRGGIGVHEIDSVDVIFTAVLIDDSWSIKEEGNTQAVIDGHNAAIEELNEAIQKPKILFRTQYMKQYVLNDWLPLDDCRYMNQANYNPNGHTPLYDSAIALARSLVDQVTRAKTETYKPSSRFLIVTDGEDQGSQFSAADVKEVLRGLRSRGVHGVALMGISNGHTDYHAVAKSMGISSDKVLTPDSKGSSIRRAFVTWSRQGAFR